MYSIQKVKKEDNKALAAMIRAVFIEHDAPQAGTVYSDPTTDNLYQLFRHPKSVLWVAKVEGKPVGCCGIYPTEGLAEDCTELVKFYLDQTYRGQGIGLALMQKSIASAQALGYQSMYLESIPHYNKAIGMYEKQGFVMLDHPLGNSGHNGCDVWMLKQLNA